VALVWLGEKQLEVMPRVAHDIWVGRGLRCSITKHMAGRSALGAGTCRSMARPPSSRLHVPSTTERISAHANMSLSSVTSNSTRSTRNLCLRLRSGCRTPIRQLRRASLLTPVAPSIVAAAIVAAAIVAAAIVAATMPYARRGQICPPGHHLLDPLTSNTVGAKDGQTRHVEIS
jgi:hypothetical protein